MSTMPPVSIEAYRLLHEGALAIGQAERHGIMVDVDYCKRKVKHIDRQMKRSERKIQEEPEVQLWKKKYGPKFKLSSDKQLGDILYNELGIKPFKYTDATRDNENEEERTGSTDQEALSKINRKFIKYMLENRRLKTVYDDLNGILREQVGGWLHPFFNLHLVDTYRSSSDSPNFQNMPIRDPLQGQVIRNAILPRPGQMLVEIDYDSIEVKSNTWYHKDPTMMTYVSDPSKDMHRDMAAQLYMIDNAPPLYWKDKKTGKLVRYCGKNKYVFPEFYGSYYVECAKNLWNSISEFSLVDPQGRPLTDHLKSKGIRNLKQFTRHVKSVEEDFWGNRFAVYGQWKEDWYEAYQRKGYFNTLTGFRCGGFLRKNQVTNYPAQGSAFHCLLWSFIQITKIANARGWRSRPIGQIHDSIILDVHPDEFNEVMDVCNYVMTVAIKEHWSFINTPMGIECETGGVDKAWHAKKEVFGHECSSCGCLYGYRTKEDDRDVIQCPICFKTTLVQ